MCQVIVYVEIYESELVLLLVNHCKQIEISVKQSVIYWSSLSLNCNFKGVFRIDKKECKEFIKQFEECNHVNCPRLSIGYR